jgi:hypothetical protein
MKYNLRVDRDTITVSIDGGRESINRNPTYFNQRRKQLTQENIDEINKYKIVFFKHLLEPLPKLNDNIIELRFGKGFDQPIPQLPRELRKIWFEENKPDSSICFNHDLDLSNTKITVFPILSPYFSAKIIGFPPTLKHFVLPHQYCDKLDILPYGLTQLTINGKFNQPLDNLPNSIKEIYFDAGSIFNQPVDVLPSNLKILSFGKYFNHNINNLPNGLQVLILSTNFDKSLNNLPDSLTHLDLERTEINHNIKKYPPNLFEIKFNNKFNNTIENLPKKLKIIYFGMNFNQKVDTLPDTLEEIYFNYYFNQSINNLPDTMRIIDFNHAFGFNRPITKIPSCVKKLRLNPYFQNRFQVEDANLESLTLQSSENFASNIYPKSLNTIIITKNPNKPKFAVPKNFENMEFSFDCDFVIFSKK